MYPSEPPRRSLDVDSVPTDWSYVQSVEEGLRKRQAQNIAGRSEPQIRHRAEPTQPGSGPAVARSVLPTADGNSPFVLPNRAYQQPPQTDQSAAVQNQLSAESANGAVQPSPQPAARARRRAQIVTQDGSQFEKPAEIQIPEWLRVAQQNTTPASVRRPPPPRVQAAPQPAEEQNARPLYGHRPQQPQRPMRQAEIYAAAGYPPELLAEQQRLDALQEAQQLRKRRGAMAGAAAERPPAQPHDPQGSYPPPRSTYAQRRPLDPQEQAARLTAVQHYSAQPSPLHQPQQQNSYAIEADEEETAPRIRIPWLGLLASIAVLLSVFLWIDRLNTADQLEKVYEARVSAQQQVADEHPYQYRELIEAQADQYNLHPAFVASIVLNESSFRPHVKSSADAMGLMQIRPDTGEYINRQLDVPGYNHDMLYDPETNIRFGCCYLGELSERFGGDPVLVAAAYNAGPTNVQNWLNNSTYSSDRRTLPIENIPFGDTQTYARRVLRDYAAYKRLYYENPEAQ